jgi:hypothetical protein
MLEMYEKVPRRQHQCTVCGQDLPTEFAACETTTQRIKEKKAVVQMNNFEFRSRGTAHRKAKSREEEIIVALCGYFRSPGANVAQTEHGDLQKHCASGWVGLVSPTIAPAQLPPEKKNLRKPYLLSTAPEYSTYLRSPAFHHRLVYNGKISS